MNTRLGPRGYVVAKESINVEEVRQDLTVSAVTHPDFAAFAPKIYVYKENARKMYLPRFYGLAKYGAPSTEEWHVPAPIQAAFKGELRPSQVPAAEAALSELRKTGGAVLVLPCGFGKTALAIYVACTLKVKTLVMVHTSALMHQWLDRISSFSDATAGTARGDRFVDGDITVAMIQSVVARDYDFTGVGLVIVDEAHHVACEVFSRALPKTAARYMLGLSATPVRKDGLSCILHWYIGDICYEIEAPADSEVSVRMLWFADSELTEVVSARGQPQIASMINQIATNPRRMTLIVDKLEELLLDKDRKVLVLSERLSLLREIAARLPEDSALYVGGKKPAELAKAAQARVVLGTYAIAKEGLDIPQLNALVLATPMVDIKQAVGRILRMRQACKPLIVDVVDRLSCFPNQARRRKQFYVDCGYTVK